ncbi:class IIb bacteriocin, lactobin A/cerein 7B family [Paraclostridium sordellii]|uniref:class IIb bacteriocin, lactobin A/cerein 7B family n=1 Tax=Paraclostridium sordellii TaxID=1505 RepID=UPI0030D4A0A0
MNELKFDDLQDINGGKADNKWAKHPYKCIGAVVLGTAAGAITTGGNPWGALLLSWCRILCRLK